MSESWYRDGSCVVLVVTGQPSDSVRIGVGESSWRHGRRTDAYADARDNLQVTAMQSVGRDSGERAALEWAHHAGWISHPRTLQDDDGPEHSNDSDD